MCRRDDSDEVDVTEEDEIVDDSGESEHERLYSLESLLSLVSLNSVLV